MEHAGQGTQSPTESRLARSGQPRSRGRSEIKHRTFPIRAQSTLWHGILEGAAI